MARKMALAASAMVASAPGAGVTETAGIPFVRMSTSYPPHPARTGGRGGSASL